VALDRTVLRSKLNALVGTLDPSASLVTLALSSTITGTGSVNLVRINLRILITTGSLSLVTSAISNALMVLNQFKSTPIV